MTTVLAERLAVEQEPASRPAAGLVAKLTARRAIRSGAIWGAVFGVYVAAQALSYATSYPTVSARRALAHEFGTNAGISALVGPARNIDTVGGFTAWKCLTVLAITGAIWGVLTATRLLRGEEDAGRWELLLCGRTTRRGASAQGLAGLAGGAIALFLVMSVILVLAGRSAKIDFSTQSALFFAISIIAGPLLFLAVGAVASQLFATRRQASSCAVAVLGASYALRMVADSSTDLGWLRWLTPLGWIEELQPLTKPAPIALVPIVATFVVLGALSVFIAGRRDVGGSVFADRSSSPPNFALLSSSASLSLRTQRSVLAGWAAGIVAYGLLLGGIARSGGQAITSSPSLKLAFARLGVSGPQAYVGLAMVIMSVLLCFVACGQVGAARNEEASGRLEVLLVRSVSRGAWLWGRYLLCAAYLFAGGLLAGLATWVGASLCHAGIGFPSLLSAGINVVPPALVFMGLGVFAIGLRPRSATALVYGVFAWSLLIELLGGVTHLNGLVLDTSVFHQMAAAPSAPIDWLSDAILVAVALASAAVGVALFLRRDITGE